ncbi:MAG: hypothetical protein J5497_02255 [Selenomonadaceae bacterium]|nr:hypothetical protein [Selenomonadaceae bacterium]
MIKDIIKKIFAVPASAIKSVRSASGEFLLKETDFGLVYVELEVVKNFAERALQSVEGIKETEVAVERLTSANPLRILLTASLVEGYSALQVSKAADRAINGALKEFMDVEFYVPVEVRIRQIAQVEKKRRRVR